MAPVTTSVAPVTTSFLLLLVWHLLLLAWHLLLEAERCKRERGSTASGHYVAYVRDRRNRWCFGEFQRVGFEGVRFGQRVPNPNVLPNKVPR